MERGGERGGKGEGREGRRPTVSPRLTALQFLYSPSPFPPSPSILAPLPCDWASTLCRHYMMSIHMTLQLPTTAQENHRSLADGSMAD